MFRPPSAPSNPPAAVAQRPPAYLSQRGLRILSPSYEGSVLGSFPRPQASGGPLSRAGISPPSLPQQSSFRVAAGAQPPNPKKEDKLVTEGLITELLPNCMFRVRLDNGEIILGYVSGKMRTKMVRVLVGDKVRIEVSRYDSTRGRIVYRLRSKSSTD
ncbi:unnamed protein product [Spirodela intermedia]|uniref:Translation initiation factor IF-1, chloroplastic n=2 Tax=Spirodela intermedia TaxID=51605 RepID=A0A7I8KGD3_SPIIN|nr:unnamed protein product [Spirodela intermedia]